MLTWITDLTVSDYLIIIAFAALLWFIVDYGGFTPWWRVRQHGWIGIAVLLFTFSVFLLMGLIIWGTIVGQRVPEPARIVVAFLLAVGMVGKTVILHHERKVGRANRLLMEGNVMSDTKTPRTVTVPDIWYKAQRVLRTIVAAVLGAVAAWGAFQLFAPQILAELATILPGSWITWLASAIALISAIAGVITRIMAIPGVNALLIKIGLGSVPKKALVEAQVTDTDTGEVHVITSVEPDPRADTGPVTIPPLDQ